MKIATALWIWCCASALSAPGQGVCNEQLRPISHPTLGYQSRSSDRCEGFYREAQSGAGIFLVSYTYQRFEPDLASKVLLEVTRSPSTQGKDVYVQATPFPLKTYFQMDAVLPDEKEGLIWPMDLLREDGRLSSKDIGVSAWIVEGNEPLYQPLRWGTSVERLTNTKLRVYLRSFSDLTQIRYLLQAEGVGEGQNQWKRPFFDSADAGVPILVDLSTTAPGKYTLRLAARERFTERPVYSPPVKLQIP